MALLFQVVELLVVEEMETFKVESLTV